MVTSLFALAFAISAVPNDAESYLRRLSQYPEAVEFRNVRSSGGLTCGEMNEPWNGRMSGFLPFAFRDQRNWTVANPNGQFHHVVGGNGQFTERHNNHISAARRRGDDIGVRVLTERKRTFETEARAALAACNGGGTLSSSTR